MRTQPTLKKNRGGIYEIRWSEQQGKTWRSQRRSTQTDDYGEAVTKLSEFLSLKEVRSNDLTVRQVYDHYLRYHSMPRGNDRTDEFVLRAPLGAFGDWPAKSLTDPDVERYISQRMRGKYGPKEVQPSTVRRELVALQAVLNYGCKKGLIHKDRFSLPKPSDGAPRQVWIDEEAEREILARLPEASLDVQLFVRMALTYGVRKGAMMDLRFGPQVDFLSGSIDFHVPGARVTRKRRPAVPMTSTVRGLMEQLFQVKKRGDHVLERSTPHQYDQFMKGIGYEWVTPHALKHSAITLMLRAGTPPGDVSRLTATDLRTIYGVYRHYGHQELLEIAERRAK